MVALIGSVLIIIGAVGIVAKRTRDRARRYMRRASDRTDNPVFDASDTSVNSVRTEVFKNESRYEL